jgi:hypothetical protein
VPASKVVNVDEARRWILERRSYQWIIAQYRERYQVETTVTMWSNFRRRQGIETRNVRDESLIPWRVERPHRGAYLAEMLRLEARQRVDAKLSDRERHRLGLFRASLAENDAVIHYDPDSENGFYYVQRRDGVDRDIIREPERPTKWTRR